MHRIVQALGWGLSAHFAAGIVFACVFHAVGITRVDPAARGAGLGFRLLVTPGVIGLWPVLLLRWRQVARSGETALPVPGPVGSRRLRAAQAHASKALAVFGPVLLAVALLSRPPAKPAIRAPCNTAAAKPPAH
jgi:hypothetical protein